MSLTDTNTKNEVAEEFVSLVNQGNRLVTQLEALKTSLLSLKSTVNTSDIFTAEEEQEVQDAIVKLAGQIQAIIR